MLDSTHLDRLWSRIDQKDHEDCWPWIGAKNGNGYGRINLGERLAYPHRLVFEVTAGPIPDGMQVDHTCHNRSCCNPAHLRLATPKQNNENRSGLSAHNTSGVAGVYWRTDTHRWSGQVRHLGRTYSAGSHLDLADAERAVVALRNSLFTYNDIDRAS